MRKVYWNLCGKEIIFDLNWLEYLVLKRIFYKRKYKILKPTKIRGEKINLVIVDECGVLK